MRRYDMKTFQSVVVLIAFVGLVFLGCSEKSQLPNEPVNSLEKLIITDFTAINYPTGSVDPGEQKIVGGNLILRNMILTIRWDSDNELIASDGIGVFNCNADAVTGEGHYWGKVTLSPDVLSDGEWEITWTGNCTKTGVEEWTLILKIVGHGRGGSINGMQLFADNIAIYNEPFPLFWISNVTGFIKSHGI
jgi:hypothetical protein